MKIKDYMTKGIVKCNSSDDIHVIAEIMEENNIGFVAVEENDEIIGVITDRDIVIGPVLDNETSINDYIAKNIISLEQNEDIEKALSLMKENKVDRLLITDKEKYIGVLAISDFFDSDLKDDILEALKEIKD